MALILLSFSTEATPYMLNAASVETDDGILGHANKDRDGGGLGGGGGTDQGLT